MMYATKIKMLHGCAKSNSIQHIRKIYIEGCEEPRFYRRAEIHDYLVENPNSIRVNIEPNYPYLLPVTVNGVKFVRSEANDTPHDNLLSLPKV